MGIPAQAGQVRVDERPGVVLRGDDALDLTPQRALAALPQMGRIIRDLETLLRIAATLPTIRCPEDLARRLLAYTFEAIPAQLGAIVLRGGSSEETDSVFAWRRDGRRTEPPAILRAVLSRVVSERVSVLTGEIPESGFGSLLAVPLIVLDNVAGALCLCSGADPATRLEQEHLELAAGIAGISAGALDNAMTVQRLESENRRLRAEVEIEHGIVGKSAAIRAVFGFIVKVAPSHSTVLIRGESGTGKELVARAIHDNSPRANKPFAAINCAALTEALLESELFGHEKGAFTGAYAQKKGRLEEAEGGSVFLDEVGELAPALQAKLLRVLQQREYERVGGTRTIKTDIRLVAATNRDLEEAVRTGLFRRDLYYRLNVVSTTLPPLRERREDILLLAEHFLRRHCDQRPISGFSKEACQCLLNHDWPGNVRELENAVERAAVLGSTEMILPDDLPEAVVKSGRQPDLLTSGFQDAVKEAKKRIVLRALEEAGGSYTAAARILQLHPNNLHRLVTSLKLRPGLGKPRPEQRD